MVRDLSQPFDTGILHSDGRVEPLGNSLRDEGGTLLLEQLDQPLLLRHQRVYLRRLAVKEGGDGVLFSSRGGVGTNGAMDLIQLLAQIELTGFT